MEKYTACGAGVCFYSKLCTKLASKQRSARERSVGTNDRCIGSFARPRRGRVRRDADDAPKGPPNRSVYESASALDVARQERRTLTDRRRHSLPYRTKFLYLSLSLYRSLSLSFSLILSIEQMRRHRRRPGERLTRAMTRPLTRRIRPYNSRLGSTRSDKRAVRDRGPHKTPPTADRTEPNHPCDRATPRSSD